MALAADWAARRGIYDASALERDDDPRPAWDRRKERVGEQPGGMGTLGSAIPSGEGPEAEEGVVGPVMREIRRLDKECRRAVTEAGLGRFDLQPRATQSEPPTYQIAVYVDGVGVAMLPYVGPETIAQAVDIARCTNPPSARRWQFRPGDAE